MTDVVSERGDAAIERVRELTGGLGAPELMPDLLDGRIEPGLVFDRTTGIDGVPGGYRAMNDREAIKVMITF